MRKSLKRVLSLSLSLVMMAAVSVPFASAEGLADEHVHAEDGSCVHDAVVVPEVSIAAWQSSSNVGIAPMAATCTGSHQYGQAYTPSMTLDSIAYHNVTVGGKTTTCVISTYFVTYYENCVICGHYRESYGFVSNHSLSHS